MVSFRSHVGFVCHKGVLTDFCMHYSAAVLAGFFPVGLGYSTHLVAYP